ncbi:hypothetical protein LEN26_017976 [Aphanomyces euteiches]|nr:hypothetical protein LEN26_017976 [Aphanomyces euteiches]KAH9127570.1 hypothetical protein AeMF1_002151 [Aphanomyces euteiches]KAH9188025.1 hypothetical protein AeNC1_010002 [Aphanomyces euteiches]
MHETSNIRSLILEKEKELHDINEYRIRTLEGLLKEKETTMQTYKQKFYKLQEDFKYNLKLLEGRDEELAMYDSNFATLKMVVRDRESEISNLKIQLADVQSDLKTEKQKASEGDVYVQQKLKELRGAMESTRWSYDEDLRKAKEDIESMKRRHEREMREKDEDVETIRRELTVLRQREQEFRHSHDEVAGKARDAELKVKSLGRENERLKERNNDLRRKVDELVEQLADSDKAIKALQWELADVRALKDDKIRELEADTVELQKVKQAVLDEYEGKMADLLQSLHAVEKAFLAQKNKFEDDVKHTLQTKDEELKQNTAKLEARIETITTKLRTTEDTLEKVQAEFKQSKWEMQDQLLQRDREMERLKSDHQDALEQRDSMLKQLNNNVLEREAELKASKDAAKSSIQVIHEAKEKESALRRELQIANETIEELKRQVHSATLNLETKLQEAEREWSTRQDLRIREANAAKDILVAEKQAAEERLRHVEADMMRLRGELYAQKAVVRANEAFPIPSVPSEVSPVWIESLSIPPPVSSIPSIPPPVSVMPSPPQSTDKSIELAAENAKLKSMIRTMTEELMKQTAAPSPSTTSDATEEKCRQFEAQVAVLQQKVATIQAELQAANTALEEKKAYILQLEMRLRDAGTPVMTVSAADTAEFRRQLDDALAQVEQLKKDRDALMELSNQLTSENRKLQLGTSPPSGETSFALKQQEVRIAELTQSLEEYRLHNKALKKELRRWLKRDESASSMHSDMMEQPVKPAFSLEAAKQQARRPVINGNDMNVPPPQPTLSDARLKLKHAKEVLALAGKKFEEPAGGRVRAPSLAQRETESQRSVMTKLKELQSKRAEMAEERKKVRNYSVG